MAQWCLSSTTSLVGSTSHITTTINFSFPPQHTLRPSPRSWLLHHSSSPSMKLQIPGLGHTYRGGRNGMVVSYDRQHRQLSQRTPYTFFGKALTSSPRFRSLCQVKSCDESGKTFSGESIIKDKQRLERDLQIAIEEENYAQAAEIRDMLRSLQEDGKALVLAANERFYNAFRNGDLATMQGLWSKGEHVCVVHPGVSGISGYDYVMGSWEYVWAEYEFPLEIEIKDVQVHVRGDLGYVTCIEMVRTKGSSWGKQFATNVFERVDGQWYVCIHHATYVDSK